MALGGSCIGSVAAALGLLALGGCSVVESVWPGAGASETSAPVARGPEIPLPVRKPVAPAGAAQSAAPSSPGALAALPQPPAESTPLVPAAPTSEAARLRGLTPVEVGQLLGAPAQRRESGSATIWVYATRECEIDLYFYMNLQTKVPRVLDFVSRPDGDERVLQRCLEQLAGERRLGAASSGSDRPR